MHDIKTNSQSVSQNNQKRLILGGSIVAVVTLVMLTTIPLCKAINQKKELLKQYSVNMAYEKNIKKALGLESKLLHFGLTTWQGAFIAYF